MSGSCVHGPVVEPHGRKAAVYEAGTLLGGDATVVLVLEVDDEVLDVDDDEEDDDDVPQPKMQADAAARARSGDEPTITATVAPTRSSAQRNEAPRRGPLIPTRWS
ncbi:MAG TPA: hypothetical protein VFH58_03230 [Acidimicrobiales bacterium]|nr:hypothetical protein [Acidimicrobiales bacterium]